MKKIILTLLVGFALATGHSQTAEEMNAEQARKKDSISDIQARVNALQWVKLKSWGEFIFL
jgi:hypothetical protein